MADQVDVPAVGNVDKKYVYAGVALAAGIAGYAWWRQRQGGGGAVTYAADPATGSTNTSDVYTNPDPNYSDTGPRLAPTTDQEWTSRVMETLTWYEPGYLGTILGKYLARQPLTSDEAEVVRAAWAQLGHPPSNVPIVLATDNSTPGTPTPDPQDPEPTGPGAVQITGISDIRRADGAPGKRVTWNPVQGAESYGGTFNGWPWNVGLTAAADWINPPAHGTVTVYAKAGGKTGPSTTITF